MTTEQVDWESRLIGQFCMVTTGGTPSTTNSAYWQSGQVPWLSSGEVHKKRVRHVDSFITEQGLENSAAKLLPKGSVLVALAGQGKTRGTVAITEMATTTNQSVGAMIADAKVCDPEFLFFNLDSRYEELRALSGGAGRAGLNLQILKDVDVLLPLPEQKKIASVLTSVDEVIENTQKQIDKLQDLKKATMNELLTKGIGHTEFKDSELGRIPKSWAIRTIGNLSSLVTNGFVGSASSHYRETGVPYLVSKNIRDNFIDQRGLTYISREFHEKTSKSKLATGDLLTVQSGHVGSSAVVTPEFDGANCHALILTRFNDELVNSRFIAYYLNSDTGRLRLSVHFVGSTIVHLNTSDLKRFLVPVPCLTEQVKIVKSIDCIQIQIDAQVSKLQKIQSLKKSLMQDLLTGKVRVSVN